MSKTWGKVRFFAYTLSFPSFAHPLTSIFFRFVADVEFHDGQEIPMGDVSGAILQNVVDFCQFLRDVKNSEYSDAERDQFEADFVAVEVGVLFKMIQVCSSPPNLR